MTLVWSAWIRTQQSKPLNKTADRLCTNHLRAEHLTLNTMASTSMRNGEAKEKKLRFYTICLKLFTTIHDCHPSHWFKNITLKKREKLRLVFHSLAENHLASCTVCDLSATLSNPKTSHNDKPQWIVIWFVTAIIAKCHINSTCCLFVLCICMRQTMTFKFIVFYLTIPTYRECCTKFILKVHLNRLLMTTGTVV